EFHTTNSMIGALSVSIFVLGFTLGPLILSPLSETYGRLMLYHICNVLFVIFTIGCAMSPNMNILILFRFFAGCAGSCPLTLGGGTVADLMDPDKRGGAMSVFAFGGIMGPMLGPVIGGFIAQGLGWRWVFWLVVFMVRRFWIAQLGVYLTL